MQNETNQLCVSVTEPFVVAFSYGSWTFLTFYGSTYFQWNNGAVVIMEQVAMFFRNKFVIQWCRMKLKDICTTVTWNILYIRSVKMSAPFHCHGTHCIQHSQSPLWFRYKMKINKSHRNDFFIYDLFIAFRGLTVQMKSMYLHIIKIYFLLYSEQQLNGSSIKKDIMEFWFWRDQVMRWIFFYILN